MKRILTLALALMLLLAAPALAATSVLKPTDDFYVNDAANVLTNETIGHIVLNNDALYKACGAQIVFVTLDTTGTTKLENYAYTLFNQWKIGGTKNYGFLVVMAINDDDYWYEIGSGLDQYLTAGDAGELIDQYLEPNFARQDYDGGARALFDALFNAVSRALGANLVVDSTAYSRYVAQENAANAATNRTTGTSAPATRTPAASSDEGFGIMPILIVIAVIVIIVLIVRSRKRRRVTTYENPNPTIIVNNPAPTSSARSYNRGFLAGMLTGANRRRATPPTPPPYTPPYTTQVPPQTGRANTAQRPTTTRPTTAQRPAQTPPTGGSYGGFTQPPGRASSAGRSSSASRSSGSSSTSIGSTLNSLFGSGSSRSSGFGRSSSSSRSSGRSGGFGGGRSGGGGSTRGSGGGRHR